MPVGCSADIGVNQHSLFCGQFTRHANGTAPFVDLFSPCLFCELRCTQKFAGLPIQDIVECVAISPEQQLSRMPRVFTVDEDWNLAGIPVMNIMWCKLKVPLDVAGIRVECKNTVRV